MAKKILINGKTTGETRVAVVNNNELVDFDSEISTKRPIKGNIYLAKVVRIEPSLQAVFIEYGHEKNGFLPFSEIHPDYYRIPVEDREALNEDPVKEDVEEDDSLEFGADDVYIYPDSVANIEPLVNEEAAPVKRKKHYNVQEVIHHKQVLLVQAIKDERGNKGAAFTTYLSLPGQYCVLMPNAGNRSGGVSKRIQEDNTRKRLKDVLKDLQIPDKMSAIIRTAGQERTKLEIRRDYEYLLRVWEDIRQKTLESLAPILIHEEADIFMRAIRDFYTKDVEEILVDDADAYKKIKAFMKQLSPSGVKKIKLYKDSTISLFNAYDIENQIIALISPRVELPSGGSIVIGQTEALVAIDVNSGKATKERHIDATALKTNLEAAKEIAKQLRLRDLSGLIVIDFIDMNDPKYIHQVEKCFKDEIAIDRARIQVANISQFCLLEVSRQRLRTSVMETYSEICPHCQGRGMMYSSKYFLSTILHLLEKDASENQNNQIIVHTPRDIWSQLLNEKRKEICDIETSYNCKIRIDLDSNLGDSDFVIDNGAGIPSLFSLGKTSESLDDLNVNHDHRTVQHVSEEPQDQQTVTQEEKPAKENKRKRSRKRFNAQKEAKAKIEGAPKSPESEEKKPESEKALVKTESNPTEKSQEKKKPGDLPTNTGKNNRKQRDMYRRNRNRKQHNNENNNVVAAKKEDQEAVEHSAKPPLEAPKQSEHPETKSKNDKKKNTNWLKKIFNANDEI